MNKNKIKIEESNRETERERKQKKTICKNIESNYSKGINVLTAIEQN